MTDDRDDQSPETGLDAVRARFAAAEDVPPPGGPFGPGEARGEFAAHSEGQATDAHDPRTPGDEAGPDPDLLRRAAGLPLNDHGNGRRLILHRGEDLMFVPRVGWFTWDGARWRKDPDQQAVRREAQGLADLILAEIPFLDLPDWERRLLDAEADAIATVRRVEAIGQADRSEADAEALSEARRKLTAVAGVKKRLSERRSQHKRFATSTGNSNRITNALTEGAVGLSVPLDDLDAPPLEVNCQNGVLRFEVSRPAPGEGGSAVADVTLVPPGRAQRLTKMVAAAHDPAATCPRFDAFLEEVQPDAEMRRFLQRWFGLAMSAEPVQALAFFYGMGANGKSVLVDVVAGILADYAATVRIESLTGTNRRGGGDATPDLIPLIGARFARTSEPDQGTRLQEGLIKELTGGEPILVRALHSDFVEIKPRFKLTMSGNHKPEIRGTDDGIWRRVMLVPWEVQIPEARRNPRLAAELMEEAPGILNWLVEGLLAYLEGGLAPPDSVRAATEAYRRESDPLGEFLATCCTVTGDPAHVIPAAELVHAFAFHLMERGDTPWKNRTVTMQLADKAARWRHPETGKGFLKTKASVSQYAGLRFTDAFRRRFEDAPKDQQGRPLSVRTAAPHPDDGA